MKKTAATLLAILLFLLMLAACNKPGKSPGDGTGKNPSDTGNGDRYVANVPSVTYDGATFKVMCRSRSSIQGEMAIFGEKPFGEPINDAAYYRNRLIEENFDINLEIVEIDTARVNDVFFQLLLQNASAMDYIADICIPGAIDAAALTPSGIFLDLKELKYIDLSRPWWATKLNSTIDIMNKQYFAINDMLLNDKSDTYALYFNKTLFDSNRLKYPYDSVYDGSWTFDRFYEDIVDFGQDLNHNQSKDIDDSYGIVLNLTDTFFVGSGITGATMDPTTKIPEMIDLGTKLSNVYDNVFNLLNQTPYACFDIVKEKVLSGGSAFDAFSHIFAAGNTLYMNYGLGAYSTVIANMADETGIVPIPKYDENQTEYYSRAGYNGCTAVTVLTSVPADLVDRVAIIMEAMAAESKNIISPVYYDKLLTDRYAQDPESKDMIRIIIDNEIIDLDQLFTWGNVLRGLQTEAENGTNTLASYFSKYKSPMNSKLNKTLAAYEELIYNAGAESRK